MHRWFPKKPVPLTGAPEVKRLKTYAAQSGYSYQYVYAGQRPLPKDTGTEFVFSTSADRKSWFDVSVLIEAAVVHAWEEDHGRTLSATEWYALAKMALFAAFDERTTPAEMRAAVRLREADVAAIIDQLGIG